MSMTIANGRRSERADVRGVPGDARRSRGFTMVELLIVIAIVIVGATLAGMQVARAQRNFRLANAENEFMSYVEKARVDSIRRRAKTAAQSASVTINTAQPDRYSVTMDFAGNGNLSTRVIRLPQGVRFVVAANTSIAFDWRGRTAQDANVGLTNGETTPAAMRVRRSGDIMSATQSYYNPPAVTVPLNVSTSTLTSTTNINTRTLLSSAAANAGY